MSDTTRRNTRTATEVDVREVVAPYALCDCPSMGEEPHDRVCAHYIVLDAVHDALVAARCRLLAYADRYPAHSVQDFQIKNVIGDMVEQIHAMNEHRSAGKQPSGGSDE